MAIGKWYFAKWLHSRHRRQVANCIDDDMIAITISITMTCSDDGKITIAITITKTCLERQWRCRRQQRAEREQW